MTCAAMMSAPSVVLAPDDTIAYALRLMIEHRVVSIPVVNAQGRYLGMLPRSRLIGLAIPRVLSYEDAKYPPNPLLEVGFIQESLADLQARLDAVSDQPVSAYLDANVPTLTTESPLMSALFYLHKLRTVLPVVEEGRLKGIVSIWSVLASIGRIPERGGQ